MMRHDGFFIFCGIKINYYLFVGLFLSLLKVETFSSHNIFHVYAQGILLSLRHFGFQLKYFRPKNKSGKFLSPNNYHFDNSGIVLFNEE